MEPVTFPRSLFHKECLMRDTIWKLFQIAFAGTIGGFLCAVFGWALIPPLAESTGWTQGSAFLVALALASVACGILGYHFFVLGTTRRKKAAEAATLFVSIAAGIMLTLGTIWLQMA